MMNKLKDFCLSAMFYVKAGVWMSKSILVVDDEARIRKMITRYLKEEKYTAFEACNGIEALETMENEAIDMVILDLMMPRLDGEGFIKSIRKTSDVYIIVLTAKTGENAQVHVYGLGADDYIEKPFSCKALMSKVSAIFTRLDQKTYGQEIIRLDSLSFDYKARKVYIDGKDCKLKPKEYDLLHYLLHNQNLALSREQILSRVWGADYFGSDRTVDIHISNLRKKLSQYGSHIQTISGYGYKLEVKK
jgi:DNA-binding response OmpR family regulator